MKKLTIKLKYQYRKIHTAQWGGNKYEISLDQIDWTSKKDSVEKAPQKLEQIEMSEMVGDFLMLNCCWNQP